MAIKLLDVKTVHFWAVIPAKWLSKCCVVYKVSAVLLFPAGTANGKYCCPQLFINHRCFSGPYLNKGRIAELPQSVGPGKCVLVLKEVKLILSHHRLTVTGC